MTLIQWLQSLTQTWACLCVPWLMLNYMWFQRHKVVLHSVKLSLMLSRTQPFVGGPLHCIIYKQVTFHFNSCFDKMQI